MAHNKYEVLADRISLVVEKGSIVIVDERQYEIARPFLKEVRTRDAKPTEKSEDKKEVKQSLAQAAKENKISNSNKNNRK